ncbi:peptidoglycan D,D-transpeptidase FtsI family protein [Leucobacter soli]|uniref:Penicillin-binding protein A n=1 Tax=Leucobacter soli TaxID=2812850 RepID=A0A916JVT6_9MICO|nr:penicillin-binding transpeptidase domain-containing protein [Leucobacter soli]CAG7607991.1 Penicillin-binding protein A [Leucobacter soli]
MTRQLKALTRVVFLMFLALFFAVTMIQFVNADELRANEYNTRTLKNSYKVERGSILVEGEPIAFSTPTNDSFRFERQYDPGRLYAPVTGYYSRQQGMTGLEDAMNEELSGTSGSQFLTRIMRTLTNSDPQGSSVETTISAAAQTAAAKAMKGYDGAVVALDPSTGKILAMVSTPGFDPNKLSSNDDAEIISNYRKLDADETRPLVNRAIAGDLYHPGSTYKLITAAAAIESGDFTPKSTFDNPATLQLPQSTAEMKNWSRTACGSGSKVTLQQAMVYSCNIPIAEMAMEMDRDAVPAMAHAFGFDQELSVPLTVTPSTSPPLLDDAQVAIASIGQLDVRATPLQMAMVSAGIANEGVVMKPQLVNQVISPDLRIEQEFEPEEFSTPISPETADTLAMMMEHVVEDADGTGRLAAIDGVRVAGKTGTAENGFDEDGTERPYTLWFTGFAPVEDPEIAIAVVIADGGGEAHGNAGSSYDLPTEVGKQVMEAVLKR